MAYPPVASFRSKAIVCVATLLLLGCLLLCGNAGAAGAAHGRARLNLDRLPPGLLRQQLDALPPAEYARARGTLESTALFEDDMPFIRVTRGGGVHLICAAPSAAELATAPTIAAAPLVPAENTFQLHSRPGAGKIIYLDFDGHVTTGTSWNSAYFGGQSFTSAPWDIDGNPSTFSSTELTRIQYLWQRVAEDYAPFDVDVTTEDPGATVMSAARAQRVVISTTAWYQQATGTAVGGIAYIGSFNWGSDTPCYAFSNSLANSEKYMAEACSHESGHTMGLYHDGKTDGTEYYAGHGSGATGWAPIMGNSYYKPVSHWSKGEYYLANRVEDDLAIIAGKVGYRTDDHGNTPTAATALTVQHGTMVTAEGSIERTGDADVFSFLTGTGTITLTVTPYSAGSGTSSGANLDVQAELYAVTGGMIASSNLADQLDTTLTVSLSGGTYYLLVRGAGVGDPLANPPSGYTSYASLGRYTITGAIVDPQGEFDLEAPTIPENLLAAPVSATRIDLSWSPSTDNVLVAGYVIRRNDTVITQAAGTSFSDTGLSEGMTYTYTVAAFDPSGNTSAESTPSTATTLSNQAPVAVATVNPISGNITTAFQFSGTGSYDPDGAITGWQWTEGSTVLATTSTISRTFSAGTHTIVLTVTDNLGKTDAQSVTIAVNHSPIAVPAVTPASGDSTTLFQFDGTGSYDPDGTVMSWRWSEYNTVHATTPSFQKTFTPGTHTITLLVTDNQGATASKTIYLTVNDPPVARASVSPASGDTSTVFQFVGTNSYDLDGTIAGWKWTEGGAVLATTSTFSNTFSAGTHTIVLTVTDNLGKTDSQSVTITVAQPAAKTLYVARIDMAWKTVKGGVVATAKVYVLASDGKPPKGVAVTGNWTGTKSGVASGKTGTDGTVTISSPKVSGSATFTLTVTGVTLRGYAYDPSLNVETSDTISR